MTITVADLVGLKQQIATDLERLKAETAAVQNQYDAVELLERRLRAESTQTNIFDLKDVEQTNVSRIVNVPGLAVGFAGAVRQSVRHFHDEQFTVKNVETVLRGSGAPLPANNLRARIAGELAKLVKQKVITITRKGNGSSPNSFRLLDVSEDGPEKNEGTDAPTSAPSRVKIRTRPVGRPILAA